ncbi:MAG: hypothetical protein P0111_10965 [Nitrospira sp.]|nr:hypothetical protein [Nitrospira sp.]
MPEIRKGIQLCNNVTELTAIAPLNPGGAERLRMIFDLRKRAEQAGDSSPIEQIESIHYARWVILDGGTRLLFTSNFDGDLEGYLAEFAERDEGPLNMIFGNCIGWPGARPVGPFIQYVRDHMVPAEYYYSAYPRHTVKEVKRALYWKGRTEHAIARLLPELADTVEAISECCKQYSQLQQPLGARMITPKSLDDARGKIHAFLTELALPTPEDFDKH